MKQPLGPQYVKLWTASVVSNFGDGVAQVGYPWLASAVTRNPVHIALLAVAVRLPWLVFSLPAGVITDRVDRRRLVGWMDLGRFVITLGVALVVLRSQAGLAQAGLTLASQIQSGEGGPPANAGFVLAILYTSALLLGIAEVLRDNAAQTLMPSIVATDNLEKANGRLWGAEMVMNSFVGPPLGGVLLAIAFALPFFVDAGSFAVAAGLVFLIAGQFSPKSHNVEERRSFSADLKEGVAWLWRHPLFRSLGMILGIINAAGMMTGATYVLFAQEILRLDAARFGALMSAGAAGGVAGSLLAAWVSKRLSQGGALFLVLLGSSATTVITGLTSSALMVWAMFAIGSFLAVVWNVITVSLRQSLIPDFLLGRVNSVYRFFGWGMMPIGALIGGWLVAAASAVSGRPMALRLPFLVAGAVQFLLFFYALPRLNTRRIEAAKSAAAS
ncbi:MAG: MFS transporter [Actinomycetota bacterium]